MSLGVDEQSSRPFTCDSVTVLHFGNIRRLKEVVLISHTHSQSTVQMSVKIIIINNKTSWTCEVSSQLVGLPGQVGVPGDGDYLDDGQSATRSKT